MVILWFLAGAAIEVLNTFTRKWSVDRLHNLASVGWIAGGVIFREAGHGPRAANGFRRPPRRANVLKYGARGLVFREAGPDPAAAECFQILV